MVGGGVKIGSKLVHVVVEFEWPLMQRYEKYGIYFMVVVTMAVRVVEFSNGGYKIRLSNFGFCLRINIGGFYLYLSELALSNQF